MTPLLEFLQSILHSFSENKDRSIFSIFYEAGEAELIRILFCTPAEEDSLDFAANGKFLC